MSRSRLLGTLFLAALAFVSSQGIADDYPPGTPDDIKAIFEKMKHGQMPTKAEQARIIEWQKGMAAKAMPNPRTGGPNDAQGIPCRVEATIEWKENEVTGSATAWTEMLLFPQIDGTDDYNMKLADPSSHLSVLRFEPKGPVGQPVLTGGGSFKLAEPGLKIEATFEHVMGGMMLVTSGHGDSLFPMTAGIGGKAVGTACDATAGCRKYEEAAKTGWDHINFPFAMEKHQWDTHEAEMGKPTPVPSMSLHLKPFKDAIAKGGTQTISADESFGWHDAHVSAGGKVTLKITLNPKPLELVIDPPVDYPSWEPVPISDDPQAQKLFGKGTRLKFRVHLEATDKTSTPTATGMDFYLREVSHRKGIAGNYPKGGDLKPDLVFSTATGTNQALTIDASDPTHARLKAPATAVDVTVEATDTGAYGELTAEAKALSLQGRNSLTGQTLVRIPKDDDSNQIADAWTDRWGFTGLPASWDEETIPAQMVHKGDSLTLLEEYRGFVLLDDAGAKKWMRLEPTDHVKRRKTFVLAKTKHFDWIKEAVAKFTDISDIRVYFVPNDDSVTQLGPSSERMNWLNFNSGMGGGGLGTKAFVIRIEDATAYQCPVNPGQVIHGQTIRADGNCEAPPDGPWKLKAVFLFPDRSKEYISDLAKQYDRFAAGLEQLPYTQRQLYLLNATARQLADNALKNADALLHELYVFSALHEMFHALGAWHHGGLDFPDDYELDDGGTQKNMIKDEAQNCPMFYWTNPYGTPFFLGAFDPSKAGWVIHKNEVGAGHTEAWTLCAENWPQIELKP